MHDLLKEFPVVVEVPVAWGEMDSFRHVNNIVYFRYFENARIQYFLRTKLMGKEAASPVGPILAQTSCRFRKAIVYPDTVLIGVRISALSPDRFIQEYRIVSKTHHHLVAEGESLTVAFDYQKEAKAKFSSKILGNIVALEGKTPPPVPQKGGK